MNSWLHVITSHFSSPKILSFSLRLFDTCHNWTRILFKMTKYQENSYDNIYQHKYQDTSIRMTGFLTLMFKWRASFLNLIYHNILVFVFFYSLLSLLYRFIFMNNPYQKELFELICIYSGRFMEYIPLGFLIAFYVQQVLVKTLDIFFLI